MSEKVEGQSWKKYSPEFKRNAVDRMVAGESPTALARELGMRRKFLYAWRDAGWGSQGGAKARSEADRERAGEQRNDPAKGQDRRVGATERTTSGGIGFFRRSLAQRQGSTPEERRGFRRGIYQVIQRQAAEQGATSIERMCELGKVSRAGFYRDWQERQPQEAEMAIREAVQQEALRRRILGYRRVTQALQRKGIAVGRTCGAADPAQ